MESFFGPKVNSVLGSGILGERVVREDPCKRRGLLEGMRGVGGASLTPL